MKIGLALGGGGAKGFAHIGVLDVLGEAGIEADVVAGTSIGSLVGAVYCAGGLEKLKGTASNLAMFDIPQLLSPAWSLKGLFDGKNAMDLLSDCIDVETIEELPKRFAAISVDLIHSRIVSFTRGNIRQAVRASIAIPALFTPVSENEQVLVDGGTLEPVPAEAARSLGADFVIAVDLFGGKAGDSRTQQEQNQQPEIKKNNPGLLSMALAKLQNAKHSTSEKEECSEIRNIFDIIERTLSISQQQLTEFRLREHPVDFLIQPSLDRIGLLDFHQGSLGIELGRRAAEAVLPKLKEALEA